MKGGFTLIESSIALVVIGLLAAGILIGLSLMDSAKMQSVIADIYKYETAIEDFESKYKYKPGDFPNASQYWSGAYNGNGDGDIGDNVSGRLEYVLVWHHLGKSGLLDTDYSGISGSIQPGINVPHLKQMDDQVNGGLAYLHLTHFVFYLRDEVIDGSYTGPGGSFVPIGNGKYQVLTSPQVFVAEQLYYIDNKIDNAKPLSGRFGGGDLWGSCHDYASNTYKVESTAKCYMEYNIFNRKRVIY